MPEPSVMRLPRAIVILNWCKGYVAGSNSGLSYKEVSTILRLGLISVEPEGSANGEGSLPLITDSEVRRLGHGTGLDTPLLLTVNDVDY